jgi:hypothetical protein
MSRALIFPQFFRPIEIEARKQMLIEMSDHMVINSCVWLDAARCWIIRSNPEAKSFGVIPWHYGFGRFIYVFWAISYFALL